MKKRAYRKPYRIRQKKSPFRFLKNMYFWVIILLTVVFSTLGYAVFFSPFFQLQEIRISGNEKAEDVVLHSQLEALAARDFVFFDLSNLLLIPKERITASLLDIYPAIETVTLKRKLPHTLSVDIVEREKVAQWCKGEKCFAVDKAGIIFEEQEVGKDDVIVSRFVSDTNRELGDKVIDPTALSVLLRFKNALEEYTLLRHYKLQITEFVLESPTKITLKTSDNWDIYITPEQDFDWQRTKLELVIDEQIPIEKRGNLQYIELRYGAQAYIKYRE